LLAEGTFAPTGRPDWQTVRAAGANASSESQAPRDGRTAADPSETSELAHPCRPVPELEVN
jgi:hypothetical protein